MVKGHKIQSHRSQGSRSKVKVKVKSTQRSKVKSQNRQDEIKNANQTDKIHGFKVIRTFRRSTSYIISYRLETAKIQQQVNILLRVHIL